MRAVNLLPLDARGGRRRPPMAAVAVAGAGVFAASLLAAGFFTATGTVDERERELDSLEQQVAAAKRAAAAKPEPAQTGLAAAREQRYSALNDALAKRLAWDRVLREVSLVLPDDVWLSSLAAGGGSATAPAPEETAAPTAGQAVTFDGFTYSQESVARLLRRLALVPNLSNVKLEKSTVTQVGSQQIYGFTILAEVIGGGGQ